MNHRCPIFAQLLTELDPKENRRCAVRHPMVSNMPARSPHDHFAVMVFSQLTYRERLCDIEACLSSRQPHALIYGYLWHAQAVNLAYANEHRPAVLLPKSP